MTAEQRAELRASSGNADKGKGIKARDGSATGSQRMGSGSRGAGVVKEWGVNIAQ